MRPAPQSFDFDAHDRALQARKFVRAASLVALGPLGIEVAEREKAPRAVVELVKAAVSGLITDEAAVIGDLAELNRAFIAALASAGLFDACLASMQPGMAHSRFGVLVSHAVAAERGEGDATRATKMELQDGSLPERRVAAIVAMSQELLRHGRGLDALEQSLTQAIATATDSVFVTALDAIDTAVTATGMTPHGVYEDLRAGLAALQTDAGSRIHVGMSSDLAKRLSAVSDADGRLAFPGLTHAGGMIAGLPASVTAAAGANVWLVDASGFVGDGEQITMAEASHATLQLDTAPTNSIGTGSPRAPVATDLISLWQANAKATRVERRIAFKHLRSGCVVKLAGAANVWGLAGSPPA